MTFYEVWGKYSREDFRDEFLGEFETQEEADDFVYDFEIVQGRVAYAQQCWR